MKTKRKMKTKQRKINKKHLRIKIIEKNNKTKITNEKNREKTRTMFGIHLRRAFMFDFLFKNNSKHKKDT